MRSALLIATLAAALRGQIATDLTGRTVVFATTLRLPDEPASTNGLRWIRWRDGEPVTSRANALGASPWLSPDGQRIFGNDINAAVSLEWATGGLTRFERQVISANGRWLAHQESGERTDLLTNTRRPTGLTSVLSVTNDGRVAGRRGNAWVLWSESGETEFGGGLVSPDGAYSASLPCVQNCELVVIPVGGAGAPLRIPGVASFRWTATGRWLVARQTTVFLLNPATGERRDLPDWVTTADVSGDDRVAVLLDAASGVTRLDLTTGALVNVVPAAPALSAGGPVSIAPASLTTVYGAGLSDAGLRFTLDGQPLDVVARSASFVQFRTPAGLRYGTRVLRVTGARSPLVRDGNPVDALRVSAVACAIEPADPPWRRPVPDAEGNARLRISGLGPAEFLDYKLRSFDVVYGVIGRLTGFIGNDRREDMPLRLVQPGVWEVTFPYSAAPFQLEFGRECRSAVVN